MAKNEALQNFKRLSAVLTGQPAPDPVLAEAYLARLQDEFPAQMFDTLRAFAAIADDDHLVFEVKRRIVESPALGAMAQKIIAIWYTSEFAGVGGAPRTGTQAQFNSGLLWKSIGADAPANSKLKSGDWSRPPQA